MSIPACYSIPAALDFRKRVPEIAKIILPIENTDKQ